VLDLLGCAYISIFFDEESTLPRGVIQCDSSVSE
jgi:hypothetical protein